MFEAVKHPYLVPFDGSFKLRDALTKPERPLSKKDAGERLEKLRTELAELQEKLYAQDRHALLVVFQALDAAGKDGTLKAVMSGVNPAGCEVVSFKAPSDEDLDHDFLWRTAMRVPQRGRIGIFNRSYYEEVLVVRVHPELLQSQKLPWQLPLEKLWAERYGSIRDHEEHLARNGIVVIKFWLNVSREEQLDRFIARLEDPEKHWKFAERDVEERQHFDDYMKAYIDALNATSRSYAPWYAIPADSKANMRVAVAEILVATLRSLGPDFPRIGAARRAELKRLMRELVDERERGEKKRGDKKGS